jgi:hypothetical protein
MVKWTRLHLVSKLRYNATLYLSLYGIQTPARTDLALRRQAQVHSAARVCLASDRQGSSSHNLRLPPQVLHKNFPNPLNFVVLVYCATRYLDEPIKSLAISPDNELFSRLWHRFSRLVGIPSYLTLPSAA